MATVKKSKKKIIIPICIVLAVAIAAGAIFGVVKANEGTEVTLNTITTGDIYETVSLTGEVTAGTTKEYKVSTVATVKEVFVQVGDKVKQNDVLATFDVTALDEQIKTLQSTYDDVLSSYNKAVQSQNEAKGKADALADEISKTEALVKKLQNEVKNPSNLTTRKFESSRLTTATRPATEKPQPTSGDATLPSINPDEIQGSIDDLNKVLAGITEDIDALTKSIEIIAETIGELAGSLDEEAIADMIVKKLVESGIAEDLAKQIADSIDIKGMLKTIGDSNSAQLTAAQIQLVALQGQYALFNAQADGSMLKVQKKAVDASKDALDAMKQQKQEMSEGWKAAFDGTITAVDIVPGMQTTLLTAGITLENLDAMAVTVSLGEYDLHKVKVGMPVTVTTAYGTYDAEVASIAPTASGGSSLGILDNVGSMAGISGLSSLTDSGAGVECVIAIPETDENIVAGFDADVEIKTGEYIGVTVVPIESIRLEKTGSYVYLYNEEDKTVTKTLVETGATSNTSYEVKSGLKVGDRIISAPESTYEEDTFKVKAAEK